VIKLQKSSKLKNKDKISALVHLQALINKEFIRRANILMIKMLKTLHMVLKSLRKKNIEKVE
jgi:hypothetical protein